MERIPLAIIRRFGTSARFAAAIEPVTAGEAQTVLNVELQQDPQGLRVRVQREGGVDEVRVGDDRVSISAGGESVLHADVKVDQED